MVKRTSQVISDFFFSIIFPATPSTSSSTSTDASLLSADVSSIAQGTTSSIIIADILHSPEFKLISVCCHIIRKNYWIPTKLCKYQSLLPMDISEFLIYSSACQISRCQTLSDALYLNRWIIFIKTLFFPSYNVNTISHSGRHCIQNRNWVCTTSQHWGFLYSSRYHKHCHYSWWPCAVASSPDW